MSEITVLEGTLVANDKTKLAVLTARFNHFIVDQLENGCIDTLRRHGVVASNITIARVPGAFDMPVVARRLAEDGKYAALICLGAVIRGSTPHFEHVSNACSRGLASVADQTGVPVIFGVLTVDSIEQAIERAGTKAGNKGADAALAALEMISLLQQI